MTGQKVRGIPFRQDKLTDGQTAYWAVFSILGYIVFVWGSALGFLRIRTGPNLPLILLAIALGLLVASSALKLNATRVFAGIFIYSALFLWTHALGFLVLALGTGMNLAAVLANGSRMPVLVDTSDKGAMEVLARKKDSHIPLNEKTRLWFLTDILMGTSAGDMVMEIGALLLIVL